MIRLPISKRVYTETKPIFKPVSEWKYQNHSKFWIVEDIFKEGDVDRFYDILTSAGVDPKRAKRISQSYSRINKTDAQGFTTMEFHKKMMELPKL